jgi:hypothetical protein
MTIMIDDATLTDDRGEADGQRRPELDVPPADMAELVKLLAQSFAQTPLFA